MEAQNLFVIPDRSSPGFTRAVHTVADLGLSVTNELLDQNTQGRILNTNSAGPMSVELIVNPSNNTNQERKFLWIMEEKLWIVVDGEERNKGRGFMRRIKERWDEKYPVRSNVTQQNLMDNARRFKKDKNVLDLLQLTESTQGNETCKDKREMIWTNELKVRILQIEIEE